MTTVLVTGATGFLGYHVVKRLNEEGIRPRVLEREADSKLPDGVQVERCAGTLVDPESVRQACTGIEVLLHLAFKVSVGGGAKLIDEMHQINVVGTKQLLQTAAACGVKRAVIVGSALAVGVNRNPVPLNEDADWSEHAFHIPYAENRRRAELEALACATESFSVMSVCPAFTFGPDDPVGAPANTLVKGLVSRKLRFTLQVGFGALDVRDFASGMLLVSQRGRSGERYLLSGENVTANQLVEQVASIAGIRTPRFTPPTPLLRALVGAAELVFPIIGKSAPATRDVLQVLGRYAWYDTSKARAELGWTTRPLRATLEDTIRSIQNPASTVAASRSAVVF
jgi:dihydroflavonol-4-reductase